jgi:ribosomal protein L22
VAVPNRSIASMSPTKQAELVKDLLQSLKKEAKRKGEPQALLMFTECSISARNTIKKLLTSN